MNGIEMDPHLTDEELVHYIDAPAAAAPRGWGGHMERCPRCASSARGLEEDSRLVSDWLARADFEAEVSAPEAAGREAAVREPTGRDPAAREPRSMTAGRRSLDIAPWLRAAAILVLIAAPVAALPALRTWVVERVTGGADPTVADPATAASAVEGTVLRFVPTAGEFEVRFTAESEGVITVDRSDAEEALLMSTGGAPETIVSASGLQIRNPEPGRYHLRLPHYTTGLWIRIEGRAVAVSDRQIDRGTVIELQPR